MKFENERMNLRPMSAEDRHAVFNYRSDSETNKFQGWIPQKIEDVNEFMNRLSAEINIPETWFQFVITEKVGDTIIGDIGVHFMEAENMQAELGCTLSREYHGKGYASEALKAVIDYLVKDLHKHRITASIDPSNIQSVKLFRKLGFRQEAHFVKSLLINGEWVDDLVFALLEEEWREMKS